MAGMPGFPMQAPPNLAMPMAPPQFAQPAPAPLPPMNQWQPMQAPARPQQTLPLAQLASGAIAAPPAPIKARGVAADPAPPPAKFVLPSPEELGVRTKPSLPAPQAASMPIDWNQVHARMDRLGVLRHEQTRLPTGGVRVVLLLPTSDPRMGQPVEAIAPTEAVALTLALDRAEAWMARR